VSPVTVARHYAGLIDGFVLDQEDAGLEEKIDVPVCLTNTLMRNLDDKMALAGAVCAFALELDTGPQRRRTGS